MSHKLFQTFDVRLHLTGFDCIERGGHLLTYLVDETTLRFIVFVGDAETLFQCLDLADILQHNADEEQQSACQCND